MERWKYLILLDRRTVAFCLLVLAGPAGAKTPCVPLRVLFVCPAGTVKSAIARETLRERAASAGLRVLVTSRGLHPEDHVTPTLAANLLADGIDPAAEPARALSDADVAAADITIAFDEAADAPGLRKARTWDVPSWNSNYPAAKAALSERIDSLIVELQTRQVAGCKRAGQ